MRELKEQQISEDAGKVNANKDKSYQILVAERHLVHARISTKTFDPNINEMRVDSLVQSFYPKDFDQMEQESAFIGKSVEILHDPRSVKSAKDSKIDAAANSGLQGQQMDKPLADMTSGELQIKYADLYKEQPPKGASDQSLRDAIEDKFVEIRGLENVSKLDKDAAEAGKGDLKDGVNLGAPGAKKEARDEKAKEEEKKKDDAKK